MKTGGLPVSLPIKGDSLDLTPGPEKASPGGHAERRVLFPCCSALWSLTRTQWLGRVCFQRHLPPNNTSTDAVVLLCFYHDICHHFTYFSSVCRHSQERGLMGGFTPCPWPQQSYLIGSAPGPRRAAAALLTQEFGGGGGLPSHSLFLTDCQKIPGKRACA